MMDVRVPRRFTAALCLVLLAILSCAGTVSAAETRGFLGMQVQGISPKIGAALGLEKAIGVLVRDISVDGPAAAAGIERGDLIVKMHGVVVDTFERMLQISNELRPGDTVAVEVVRLGERKTFKMTLTAWPDSWQAPPSAFAAMPELGITFATLTQKVRNRLGVRWSTTGIAVTVSDEAYYAVTPLRRGNVVVQINQQRVWKPIQFLDAYAAAKKEGRTALLLLVERSDGFKYMLQPIVELNAQRDSRLPPLLKIPGMGGSGG